MTLQELQGATLTPELQASITPATAKELLKMGNQMFVSENMIERKLIDQVHQTASGQYPHSVVLSCIDSRIPTEIVFNQGVGDIFNARVAGNIVNADILGSIEYGCKVAGCTVHFIDYGEDSGPIIGQRAFPVLETDTLDDVKRKGLEQEWQLYPECIQHFACQRLQTVKMTHTLDNGQVYQRAVVKIAQE